MQLNVFKWFYSIHFVKQYLYVYTNNSNGHFNWRQKQAGNFGHRNSETDVERQMHVIVAKIEVSKNCFFSWMILPFKLN